jgi:ABC-type Zn uptake system ZnuABC Zn-binding protein ZnuA
LEEKIMKKTLMYAFVLALVSVPAFAAKKNNISIPEDVKVGTTLVPAGDYSLTITGAGPEVQVTLTQGKKDVASFTAKEIQSKGLTGISAKDSGKVPTLEGIQLHDVSLVLEDAQQSGQ